MDKTISPAKIRFAVSQRVYSVLDKIAVRKKPTDNFAAEKRELLCEIEDALAEWRYAKSRFERATDPEMIEASIYEIKSAETRYGFLLKKAKLLGLLNPDRYRS